MTIRLPIYMLLASAGFALPSRADEPRNCPTITDQVVAVQGGRPSLFRLAIQNPEGSSVSIFQYPLGGTLQQDGPTPIDFTFVPGPEFRGTTTLTYRLTPPFGCTHSATLAKVTLVGGPATGTASGLEVDPATGISPQSQNDNTALDLLSLLALTHGGGGLCGLGLFMPLAFTAATLTLIRSRWRR